jgi:hypothetical protein
MKQEKEIKDTRIGKEEVRLSLLTDNMILYLKDHKDSTKKTLKSNKHVWLSNRVQKSNTKIGTFSICH